MKNTNSSLYKGSLVTIILKLLTEHESMYGYQITQKVKELTRGNLLITEGALYPTLHKLEEKGQLTSYMKKVDNRMRKYYKITEVGSKQATKNITEAKEFINDFTIILG